MPGTHDEKLYGLPGPQNSAVLMDIISKLKQDLHKSRADNNKLMDQLNCLIALVKRAWTGEQGAMMHLANIIGLEAPNYNMSNINRNTPVPDKTRAVQNWERLATKLLERDYNAIQMEIREKQKLFLQHRQQFMSSVMEDHQREMSKLSLHKHTTPDVADVDRRFIRCFSAKTRQEPGKNRPGLSRPRSAYRSKPHTAADMVENADVTMGDLVGPQPSQISLQQNPGARDNAFTGLYRLSSYEDRNFYRPREQYDDPNRYKQNNLFDPDVIFSPEMMGSNHTNEEKTSRPFSATYNQTKPKVNLANRPKSAVFLTESKPERPLKFETTRPISGKTRQAGRAKSAGGRRNSAPTKATPHTSVSKKEVHRRPVLPQRENDENDEPVYEQGNQSVHQHWNQSDDSDDVTIDHMTSQNSPVSPKERPPISVKVRKNDPVDTFVEELKLMGEMENEFKKSTLLLQKKLGLEKEGFVM